MRLPSLLLLVVFVIAACGDAGKLEKEEPPNDQPTTATTITGIRWADEANDGTRTLYVQTTDGQERLVESGAINHWIGSDMRTLYYSVRHGKSGFEREGEALKTYSVATGKSELVFEHDLMIYTVREAESATGRRALLVELVDGGRGAPEAVVADPERGRVFTAELALVEADPYAKVQRSPVTLKFFSDTSIDRHDFNTWPIERTESFDLDELLQRKASRETPNLLPD